MELTRGQVGFGFTLQGQGPCKLSSIVENSPASKAKLKPGDHVIAVNGKNVAKGRVASDLSKDWINRFFYLPTSKLVEINKFANFVLARFYN